MIRIINFQVDEQTLLCVQELMALIKEDDFGQASSLFQSAWTAYRHNEALDAAGGKNRSNSIVD